MDKTVRFLKGGKTFLMVGLNLNEADLAVRAKHSELHAQSSIPEAARKYASPQQLTGYP